MTCWNVLVDVLVRKFWISSHLLSKTYTLYYTTIYQLPTFFSKTIKNKIVCYNYIHTISQFLS